MIVIAYSVILSRMLFTKCCCCIPLRIGGLSIAILDLIGGFITFGMLGMVYGWNHVGYEDILAGIALATNGAFLLYGSIKNDQVSTAFHLLLSIFVTGMYGYLSAYNNATYNATIPFFVVYLFIALVNICFWMCALSFFISLRQEENVSSA